MQTPQQLFYMFLYPHSPFADNKEVFITLHKFCMVFQNGEFIPSFVSNSNLRCL